MLSLSARVLQLPLTAIVLVSTGCSGPPPSGDDAKPHRAAWTTSRLQGSPELPPKYKAVVAFPNLKFNHPLLIARMPGTDRLFVGEQEGKIYSFENRPDSQPALFFNARKDVKTVAKHPRARGVDSLYGLAFHPRFRDNRECFVCYTLGGKNNEKNLTEGSRVSRFKVVGDDPPRIDPGSEEILITFLQGGHNAGDLHFGPDGYLYISTGDAADPNPPDVFHTGQDITDLLSSVLRIDVDHKDPGKNYAVPKDNPFVGLQVGDKDARPEVWAYGFRNPWRMSFDRTTGDLWVGDVGWEQWEMVHRVEKGGNYGWSLVEARQPVNAAEKPGPTPVRPPVIELNHSDAASVTGGYVYHGKKHPDLAGTYVFGDWETRRIWSAKVNGGELVSLIDLVKPTVRVVAFGEDRDGELLFLDYDGGRVYTLERNDAAGYDPAKFPRTLSETGLFASTKDHVPTPGVYPFEINARQWQDYATEEHFIALPGTSAVTDYPEKKRLPGNVEWHSFRYHLPKDGVLVRTISLDLERGNPASRHRVETQVMHFDGETWTGYSYAWRPDQSDADLVPAVGGERSLVVKDPVFGNGLRHQTWSFASRSQCMQCHNAWAEYALAFSVEQLNREVPTPSGPKNQLTYLSELGLLNRAGKNGKVAPPYTPSEAARQPRLTDPGDAKASVPDRARCYLHANCGHCHRFGGGGSVDLELTATADLSGKVLDARPTRGTFDLPDARIVARGDPGRSVLFYRMSKFGSGRMPHIGSEFVDPVGVGLVREWIQSLGNSPTGRADDPAASGQVDTTKSLSNCSSAMCLAEKVGRENCPPDVRSRVMAAAAKLPAGNVRDLFEGYLPQSGERKLGTNPRPGAILALQGDPARGGELFFTQALQCATCHKIDGRGTDVGPNLSDIGKKRTREHILESILEPSRRVEQQYQAHLLRTVSGQSYTGLLVRRDGKGVVMKDAQNKEVRVSADDIESMTPSRQSLMPDGLVRDLTPQQAADLLAYLVSRK